MGRRKVIIVDDDRDTREMLTLALSLEGYDVSEAANGLRLISSLHVDRPDLVILDVMMSWIDGFELCRSIKKNDQFKDIPVLFLSARKSGDDQRRGLEAGACEYFTKPVQVDKLIARVRELIGPAESPPAEGSGDKPADSSLASA
jgi:DNA-binding response OmpR family regulator